MPVKRNLLALLVAIVAAGGLALYFNRQDRLPHTPDDVVAVWLEPVPEGPVSPTFVAEPGQDELPLDSVADAIPSSLPRDVWQGFDCDMGGDVVVKLQDGDEIRYGPCRRPLRIERLRKEMLRVLEG